MVRFRPLLLALALLPLANNVDAATEHLLTPPVSRGPHEVRALFVGQTYVVVWTNPGPDDTPSEHWLARVDETGRLLTPPAQIAKGVRAIPRVATTRNSALIAFAEAVPSSSTRTRVTLLWLDREGIPANTTALDFENESPFAIDLAATSFGYVIAIGGRSPRAFTIREFATAPSASVIISDRSAAYVTVGANDTRVFVITQSPGSGFPCGGCGPPPAEGRMFDYGLNRISPDPYLEDTGHLAADVDAFVVMTHGNRQFRLTRVNSDGRKIASRDRFFAGPGFRQIAQAGDTTVVAWDHHANVYFALYDRNLTPIGLADGQAYSLSNTFRSEHLYALATGPRSVLAVYTTTLRDPFTQFEPRALAYQLIDLDALPPLRPAPRPPVAVSQSAQYTATVTFQWDAVPGAIRYHLQAATTDGRDTRDVVVGADATSVRFEFLMLAKEYEVRLLVEDEHGLSAPSEALTVHTVGYEAGNRRRGVRR